MSAEVTRMEALGQGDPGAPSFPALAEAWRRAGDAERAARVAREGLRRRPDLVAGRVALGLALLDLGRADEARTELELALDAVPDQVLAAVALERAAAHGQPVPSPPPDSEDLGAFCEGLGEDLDAGEIERAVDAARPESEAMLDATDLAHSALRASELDEPELGGIAPGSPFVTHTMADLLERQGHADDARSLRAALETARTPARSEAPPESEAPGGRPRGGRKRILATLERWLDNVRRRA